ncbi:MAG: hypothetical protein CM1200mP41_12910 [Gammaproteobacteria bacterium]|nr:MAG: hypothetical protein CM1200mP41_12910 [Gammaproteobacteria bacterium]
MKEHPLSNTDGAQTLPQGPYDPRFEQKLRGRFRSPHTGKRSHQIVEDANTS